MTNYHIIKLTPEQAASSLQHVLGSNIKQLRIEQDLTQTCLANICGMSRQAIARIEKGQMDIRISYLKRIADALCVDPVSLLL